MMRSNRYFLAVSCGIATRSSRCKSGNTRDKHAATRVAARPSQPGGRLGIQPPP